MAIFSSNAVEQEGMMERAHEGLMDYQEIVNGVQRELAELEMQQELPELQQNQLDLTKQMNLTLMQLNRVMERRMGECLSVKAFLPRISRAIRSKRRTFPYLNRARIREGKSNDRVVYFTQS